jgi:hypothetical protein
VFDPLALMLVIAAISSYKWEFEKKEEFVPATTAGYLPLTPDEKEEQTSFIEPKAGDLELTADGGKIKQEEEQVKPVKKKLIERLKLNSLTNLKLPRLPEIKDRLEKLRLSFPTNKLSLSLRKSAESLKQNLSWQNLTAWGKSPILNLLKKMLPPKR